MNFKIGDDVTFIDDKCNTMYGTIVNITDGFAKIRVKKDANGYAPYLFTSLMLTRLSKCDKKTHKTDTEKASKKTKDIGTAKDATHYQKAAMQPIEMMQRFLTHQEFIGFLKGNIIKYKARASFKGNKKEDMQKARQYAFWLAMAEAGISIQAEKDSVPDNFHAKTTFDIQHNYSDAQLIKGGIAQC